MGKDVAQVLGYKEPAKAVRERVDPEDKGVSKMDTPGGVQDIVIINESGLYSLILSIKLPRAGNSGGGLPPRSCPPCRSTALYQETNTHLPSMG